MIKNGYQPIIPKKELSESEQLKKELFQKAVKDQNTLRLISLSISQSEDKEFASAIYDLAKISFTIINYIKKDENKVLSARKFIEHYQDKVVLLSRKYCSMNEVSPIVIDDDFITTKSNIRKVLIGFVEIFNNEYKKITDIDQIDINAELAVLIEDMQQQGINIGSLEKVDEEKYNKNQERISQVYDNIEERLDEIDLSDFIQTENTKPKSKDTRITKTNDKDLRFSDDKLSIVRYYVDEKIPGDMALREYGRKWYKEKAANSAKNDLDAKEMQLVKQLKTKYAIMAIFGGIISLHLIWIKGSNVETIIRLLFTLTLIPAILGFIEGCKAYVMSNEDFVADILCDDGVNDVLCIKKQFESDIKKINCEKFEKYFG